MISPGHLAFFFADRSVLYRQGPVDGGLVACSGRENGE